MSRKTGRATSFASSTGWVKPGDAFPFRVTVTNATGAEVTDAVVTMDAPPAVTFTRAEPLGAGSEATTPAQVTWTLPTVAAGTPEAPTVETLVVEARAADLDTDPEVVWKDLSVTAGLTVTGAPIADATTHGPKVVPPSGEFDTARYGDKPFPIVPVDYSDRGHTDDHTGEELSRVIKQGAQHGMIDFDDHLYALVQSGDITADTALDNATNLTDLRMRLDGY